MIVVCMQNLVMIGAVELGIFKVLWFCKDQLGQQEIGQWNSNPPCVCLCIPFGSAHAIKLMAWDFGHGPVCIDARIFIFSFWTVYHLMVYIPCWHYNLRVVFTDQWVIIECQRLEYSGQLFDCCEERDDQCWVLNGDLCQVGYGNLCKGENFFDPTPSL